MRHLCVLTDIFRSGPSLRGDAEDRANPGAELKSRSRTCDQGPRSRRDIERANQIRATLGHQQHVAVRSIPLGSPIPLAGAWGRSSLLKSDVKPNDVL